MSKRSATSELEKKKKKKKKKTQKKQAPLERHICEAVAAAVALGTRQPIILDLTNELTGEVSSFAYYPPSREVGEWYLKQLDETARAQANTEHYALTAVIDSDMEPTDVEALFKGQLDDAIKKQSDVGQFLQLLSAEEEVDDTPSQVSVLSLATFLYHQTCYCDTGSSSSSSESDEF
jgi:hypothetical protein